MSKKPIDYINLEEDMPTADEALEMLKNKIARCRQNKVKCLYIVHGYGSSGVGGAICKKVRSWLNAQVANGKIKACVFGEEFNIVDEIPRSLNERYSGLEELTRTHNHGVTVIEL